MIAINNKELISFSFEDIASYHGRESIAGAALGYMAGKLIMDSMGTAPVRGEISVETGFGGGGFRDAFEMMYRSSFHGKYLVDKTIGKDNATPAPDLGYFLFNISQGDFKLSFKINDGLIPRRYYDLMDHVRAETLTDEEYIEIRDIRESLAKQIVTLDTDTIFTVLSRSGSVNPRSAEDILIKKADKIITVDTREAMLPISYENLIKYHGTGAVCGATVFYRLFLQAQEDGIRLDRQNTRIKMGVMGDGMRDVAEHILRGYKTERMLVDNAFGASFKRVSAAGGFQNGAFAFMLSDGTKEQTYILKDALYPHRYLELAALSQQRALSEAEAAERRKEQLLFADNLLKSATVFDKV